MLPAAAGLARRSRAAGVERRISPFRLLWDIFPVNEAAPITSPRTCRPGPGSLVVTDSGHHVSIANAKLVIDGGSGTWADPGFYGRTSNGSGLPRGWRFEFDWVWTGGEYAMVGWSNSTVLALAAQKHAAFINTGQVLLRDIGGVASAGTQQYVAWAYSGVTYRFKIFALAGGGALWLISGGQYGDGWRPLGWSANGSDATVWPAMIAQTLVHKIGTLDVQPEPPPARYPLLYNGKPAGGAYQIGLGFACAAGSAMGRSLQSPMLAGSGAGWDSDLVKDPYPLKDGDTWKLWFSGQDGSHYQIGYADGADGIAWNKSASNPVIPLGGSGAPDEAGCIFPVVWKDNSAPADKRWRMLYTGISAGGVLTICYAYSPDGISWTKGPSNPVITPGGTYDAHGCIAGCLVKYGSTYYFFYGGRPNASYPVGDHVCLATFGDFEGAYTKAPANPLISARTGSQSLTNDALTGAKTLRVASTAGFAIGEPIVLSDDGTNLQQLRIEDIPDGTHLQLDQALLADYLTTNAAIVVTLFRALTPRSVVRENGVWRMWGTGFHQSPQDCESTIYAQSAAAAPDSGWALSLPESPPLWLSLLGAAAGWDARSAENPCAVLDADTMARVSI